MGWTYVWQIFDWPGVGYTLSSNDFQNYMNIDNIFPVHTSQDFLKKKNWESVTTYKKKIPNFKDYIYDFSITQVFFNI